MSIKKFLILPILLLFLLAAPTLQAQENDEDNCDTTDGSFEGLILVILDTLEERKQESGFGDKSKDPHLFLPPFEALDGIGTGLPMAIQLLAQSIQPIPLSTIPTSGINNDNIAIFGVNTACDYIKASSDPN